MKEDKKKERLAALLGLEVPKEPTGTERYNSESSSRAAEAVTAYYEAPAKFTERMCKYCEKIFAVNRANVAFCSDLCRGKHLHDIGIDWNPGAVPEDSTWEVVLERRWGHNEPLVVSPAALEVVKQVLPEESSIPVVESQEQQSTDTVPLWEQVLAELG